MGRGHAVNLSGLQLKQMCGRPGGCLPEAANPSQVPGPGSMARCAPLPRGVFLLRRHSEKAMEDTNPLAIQPPLKIGAHNYSCTPGAEHPAEVPVTFSH